MAEFYTALLRGNMLQIGTRKIDKKKAMQRIRKGDDVYAARKSNAKKLSEALSDGQCNWRDAPHVAGGYHHYHDGGHVFRGHIFYGN
ncbi:MAG: hypothetical protein FJX62_00775 [Alphaproteobacteria bacterium]|nr:hypothetical protein [Alphaproteobacteria bacterium]